MPRTALAVAAAALALPLALAACQPEPASSPSPTGTRASADPSPSGPGPTPTATDAPAAAFELPASCEQIYSAGMLATLNAQNPPLNDPGVTMLSTENVDAIELLESGIPTIRCSWGMPSEFGLATNVSLVSADQTAALEAAFRNAGFGCGAELDGTVCRVERRSISLEDVEVVQTETQLLREGVWVSSRGINFMPEGYTEDVAATLWG